MAPYVKDWRCIMWSGLSTLLMTGGITLAYIVIPPALDREKIILMLAIGAAAAPFVQEFSCSIAHVPNIISSYVVYLFITLLPSYVLNGYKIGFLDYIIILPIVTGCFPIYIIYVSLFAKLRRACEKV